MPPQPRYISRRPATPEETAATGARFIDTPDRAVTRAEQDASTRAFAGRLLRLPGYGRIAGLDD